MASGTADTGPGTAADRCNARIYLIGLATSMLGDSAMGLVAGIWVKSLTGSSSVAGLVSACVYLPSLFGPVGGVIADRVHRQRLLIQLNLTSALILLALLAVRSAAEVWIIFVVMTWYGIVLMVSGPAENALFAEMLPLEIRQRVNGWQLGLQETGRLVAPLAGAGLFALAGGGVVAVADAATFAVAAIMTSRLRLRPRAPEPRAASHWRADLLAGFAHIRWTPVLRRVLLAGTVVLGFALPWVFLAVLNLAQR